MRLLRATVTDYKCIENSNTVEFGDVTCLVGKNESGKTTFLQALERLNPLPGRPSGFSEVDFPRKRLREYRARKENEKDTVAVEAEFEMSEEVYQKIQKEFGNGAITSRNFTVKRYYEDDTKYFGLETNEKKALQHFVSALEISEDAKKKYQSFENFELLKKSLSATQEKTEEDNKILASIQAKFPNGYTKALLAHVKIPKFFYFDDYSIMSGVVGINHLVNNQHIGSGEKTFMAFLQSARTALEEFKNPANYEMLKAELEAASNAITDDVFEYWQQNRNLKVQIDISDPFPEDKLPPDPGKVLRVRIMNEKHQVSVPFSERSKGFVWFFSFLVNFTQIKEQEGNVILLLDEPGLNLHATAQADFLRVIEERLSPKYQVIYSTHSPFMIPPDHFDWVRTVEDTEKHGTKISADALRNSRETIFPIQGALGYDLAQTLFIGKDNLLVEGPSDLIYLQAMSEVVEGKNKESLDPRWVVVPVGGADKIPVFVTLLGSNKLNIAVLRDFSNSEKQRVENLIKNGFLKNQSLILLSEYNAGKDSDIEDLFGEDFYVDLANQAYEGLLKKRIKVSDLPKGDRIVKRIEHYVTEHDLLAGKRFNHYKPAVYLQREIGKLAAKIPSGTIDAFANIFERLNSMAGTKKTLSASKKITEEQSV